MQYPTIKEPKPITQKVDSFAGGYNSYDESTDTPINAVVEANNVMLEQNGKWRPRYGTKAYGATLTGPITGAPNPGVEVLYGGTRYVCVIDNGNFKYSTDGGAWTSVTTGLDTTAWTEMVQLRDRLYLANGVDNLGFIDLSDFSWNTYSTQAQPTSLNAAQTGTSGATYTHYYTVTAVNNVGETAAVTEVSVTTADARADFSATKYVTVTWSGTADQFNIYYGSQSGYLYYLATVNGNTYVDKNQDTYNDLVEAPIDDTTSGPILTSLSVVDGRLWGIQPDGAIFYSGSGSQVGAFSVFYGGGYTYLQKGSGELPKKIVPFRDGKGNPLPTALTSTAFGAGSVWHISITQVSVGDAQGTIAAAYRATGSVGTNSPRGVIEALDSVFYPSIKGWQFMGSKPSLLNVLSNQEVSRNIRPDIRNLKQTALDGVAGTYWDNILLWAVPDGSDENNKVYGMSYFTDDRGRERIAWHGKWDIGIKHFFEYTDSNGKSRLLAIPTTGTKLIEFTRSIATFDSGVVFSTRIRSGLIHWDDTHLTWARPNYAYVELANPKGLINFKVSGTQKNKGYSALKATQVTDTQSNVGLSTQLFSNFFFSDLSVAPTTFASSNIKKRTKRIGKLLNNWSWEVSSNTGDVDFTLTRIVMRDAIPEETSDPTSWRD